MAGLTSCGCVCVQPPWSGSAGLMCVLILLSVHAHVNLLWQDAHQMVVCGWWGVILYRLLCTGCLCGVVPEEPAMQPDLNSNLELVVGACHGRPNPKILHRLG